MRTTLFNIGFFVVLAIIVPLFVTTLVAFITMDASIYNPANWPEVARAITAAWWVMLAMRAFATAVS